MFDATYFRTLLKRDVEAAGGNPIVDLVLVGGHAHRVRSVLAVDEGRLTIEAYQMRGDLAHQRPRFGDASTSYETLRVVVSCESIVAVVFDPSPVQPKRSTGFG